MKSSSSKKQNIFAKLIHIYKGLTAGNGLWTSNFLRKMHPKQFVQHELCENMFPSVLDRAIELIICKDVSKQTTTTWTL